ncbi:MAG TPA: hypothetical protein VHT95_12270 [Vicinamibacterales bacterium]|nr:hypothetical protein [Vicinamibacterales bacterium]
MSDPPYDPTARYSALDGLDHSTGIVALLASAMIGLDLYFWWLTGFAALWVAISFWKSRP